MPFGMDPIDDPTFLALAEMITSADRSSRAAKYKKETLETQNTPFNTRVQGPGEYEDTNLVCGIL